MFDLTKEISLKHKNAYDLLDSEVKDIAGYGIIDQEEISNTLLNSQGDMTFDDFIDIIKNPYYN
jgi:hypothetical protein